MMHRTRMRWPLAVLSLLFVSDFCVAGRALVVDGQAAVGSVTGRVLNGPDGYVLPGATVTLTGADGNERRAVTDEHGRFQIGELRLGRYDLVAALPGFAATARRIEIGPPGSSDVVVDIPMDIGCVEEAIRILWPLEFTLRDADLVAHVRIISEGELQPWPTRPACLYMAREYTASIQTVVLGHANGSPLSALPILIGDRHRFSIGAELLVFLNWSAATRRFVLSGSDAAVRIRGGRLDTDYATFQELHGLTADQATQVIRHVSNLPAATPPPSIGFDDLIVPADRQLAGCVLDGRPWRGKEPGQIRRVFQRLFPPSANNPSERGPLPDWSNVVEAYAAKYQRAGSPDTEALAVRFQDAEQAEDRWPPRHLTGFGAIKEDTLIAGVVGPPSPCLPVVAAHLRSLQR